MEARIYAAPAVKGLNNNLRFSHLGDTLNKIKEQHIFYTSNQHIVSYGQGNTHFVVVTCIDISGHAKV